MARMFNPPHPGLTLRDDVLPALGLAVTDAAKQLGVSRVSLSRVLNGHAAISPQLALRLEAWLGIERGGDASMWLSEQNAYDLWHAQQTLRNKPAFLIALPEVAGLSDSVEETPKQAVEDFSPEPLPSSLRTSIVQSAADDGVSVRMWISLALAEVVGWRRSNLRGKELVSAPSSAVSGSATSSSNSPGWNVVEPGWFVGAGAMNLVEADVFPTSLQH